MTSEPSSVPEWEKEYDAAYKDILSPEIIEEGKAWLRKFIQAERARTLEEVRRWLEGKRGRMDAFPEPLFQAGWNDCISYLTEEITKI